MKEAVIKFFTSKFFEREFLVSVVVVVILGLQITGHLTGVDATNTAGVVAERVIALLGLVLTAAGYTKSRTEVKKAKSLEQIAANGAAPDSK